MLVLIIIIGIPAVLIIAEHFYMNWAIDKAERELVEHRKLDVVSRIMNG